MPIEFKLPELGENIESGTVLRVMVSKGDALEKNQTVLELETDKAMVEVPSSVSGLISNVAVETGDTVQVGQVVLTVEDGDAESPGKADASETASAGGSEGPKKDERQTEASTRSSPRSRSRDTAPVQRDARGSSTDEDADGEPGHREDEAQEESKPSPDRVEREEEPSRKSGPPTDDTSPQPAPAPPAVRRLARELGVDINRVPGSGPDGRISADDVKRYTRKQLTTRPGRAPESALPDFTQWGPIERVSMNGVRRRTAARLSAAWSTVPHVTQHEQADITELDRLRQRYATRAEEQGGRLTITAIVTKVVASALALFPDFNASLDAAEDTIVYKRYVHIGIAVDTDRGLLVPVIREADTKNMLTLSVEIAELADKARAGKLSVEDMEGGTFTITNLGGLGGTAFTPIVNYPQVAILGLARARLQPVVANEGVESRLLLPLALSYDHRVVDGADAVRFLRWIAEALERPFLLSLEG